MQVTVNFRVGPFGSISLNDPEYSGNMQFKDQALGLRWVNENIGQFGGDANNITLFGHSSGNDGKNQFNQKTKKPIFLTKECI